MTRSLSTSAKTVGYYVVLPPHIEDAFGSHFENMERNEQFTLLATLTRYVDRVQASGGATDDFSLYDCYMDGYGVIIYELSDLEKLFNEIESLPNGTIEGLCEALIAHICHSTEVER